MKVLMLCAGGMSSSIVVKKIRRYAAEHDIDFTLKATGVSSYEELASAYDVILLAPQAQYYLKRVRENTGKPAEVIEPAHYGIGDAAAIVNQAMRLFRSTDGR